MFLPVQDCNTLGLLPPLSLQGRCKLCVSRHNELYKWERGRTLLRHSSCLTKKRAWQSVCTTGCFSTRLNCLRHTEVLRHSAVTVRAVSCQHISHGVVVISIWCAARGTPTRSHSLRVSWSVMVVSGACMCFSVQMSKCAYAPTCLRRTRVCPFTRGLNNTCSDLNDGKCCLTPRITYVTVPKQNSLVRFEKRSWLM